MRVPFSLGKHRCDVDECAIERPEGAMMTAGAYSVENGWYGHRRGDQAMTGAWSTYREQSIAQATNCVLGRDHRSNRNDQPLDSEITYDGHVWRYQDYGSVHFDQCMQYASDAGAIIITPYTIGQQGDNYWVHSVHMCCTYEWITNNGTNFAYDNVGGGQRPVRGTAWSAILSGENVRVIRTLG